MMQTQQEMALKKSRQNLRNALPTLSQWLGALSLSEYVEPFETAGYGNMAQIKLAGLTPHDLDIVGVSNPLHRAMIQKFDFRMYSHHLRAKITSHMEMGGIAVFEVNGPPIGSSIDSTGH